MRRQRWPHELEERRAPSGPRREPPSSTGDREHGATPLEPVARSVLYLQSTAGNSAVATAIKGLATSGTRAAIQRQPKGKVSPPPAWLADAQAALAELFPKNKLMGHVKVKDYAQLNKTLQDSEYGAWTQSGTEIYIRDPSRYIDPKNAASKKWPPMYVAYQLHHEACHIVQFARAPGGPPTTWQRMLEFEQEAYTNDLAWLDTAQAKKLIPDPVLLKKLKKEAAGNLSQVTTLLNGTPKGPDREKKLYEGMWDAKLIPQDAEQDPRLLYKQP